MTLACYHRETVQSALSTDIAHNMSCQIKSINQSFQRLNSAASTKLHDVVSRNIYWTDVASMWTASSTTYTGLFSAALHGVVTTMMQCLCRWLDNVCMCWHTAQVVCIKAMTISTTELSVLSSAVITFKLKPRKHFSPKSQTILKLWFFWQFVQLLDISVQKPTTVHSVMTHWKQQNTDIHDDNFCSTSLKCQLSGGVRILTRHFNIDRQTDKNWNIHVFHSQMNADIWQNLLIRSFLHSLRCMDSRRELWMQACGVP